MSELPLVHLQPKPIKANQQRPAEFPCPICQTGRHETNGKCKGCGWSPLPSVETDSLRYIEQLRLDARKGQWLVGWGALTLPLSYLWLALFIFLVGAASMASAAIPLMFFAAVATLAHFSASVFLVLSGFMTSRGSQFAASFKLFGTTAFVIGIVAIGNCAHLFLSL